MTGRWNPRGEPAVARARRAATLSSLRAGTAGLARRQRARDGRWSAPAQAGPGAADPSWTTARILAVNLIVLCGLAAVVISISSVLEHITRQAVFVVFLIVTLFLIRRGSRLRRRGFERLGRSITAWAGLTGSLVVVSGVLSLDLTQFIPELIALCAGWLLVLGVWKDLDRLVTAAVLLVGPVVWGAFVWNRSLAGAVLIVIAAGAYARSGNVHRGLFGALVGSSVLVIVAGVHQLSHARGVNAFDAADLLALLIIVVCLVAAGELESWHEDWLAYGSAIRSITAAFAVVIAALSARPGLVASWAAATPPTALSRIVIVAILVLIALWIIVMRRPARPGGRFKIALWSLVIVILLGALTHAYGMGAIRWVAVAVLAIWGFRGIRSGLRHSHPWVVAGGFAVVLGAAGPVIAPLQGLAPLILLLVGVAAAGAAVVMLSRPEEATEAATAASRRATGPLAPASGVA